MKFSVKWIVEGEMTIEATTKEEAETAAQQALVVMLREDGRWEAELGAHGIQGTAMEITGGLVS